MQKASTAHTATYVTISSDEYESMKATIEILGNEDLMGQITASKAAKSKSFEKVVKELEI